MNVTSSIDVDVDPITAFTTFTDELDQEFTWIDRWRPDTAERDPVGVATDRG